ncbi:hypothetical protein PG996_014488 [Apiospora saccharicola]|uniref:Fungal N-terminal domain-containing protein n=1 Tax=Apiospora saccharicola TaxID=335842 RepID=A0ABR1TIG0_9PEZI
MDPVSSLSIVASALGVIKMISECCAKYYKQHKDRDRFIMIIKFECEAWKSQLTALQSRFSADRPSGAGLDLENLNTLTHVKGCFSELKKILDAAVVPEDETIVATSKRVYNSFEK